MKTASIEEYLAILGKEQDWYTNNKRPVELD
jgi:hypothetical protein